MRNSPESYSIFDLLRWAERGVSPETFGVLLHVSLEFWVDSVLAINIRSGGVGVLTNLPDSYRNEFWDLLRGGMSRLGAGPEKAKEEEKS